VGLDSITVTLKDSDKELRSERRSGPLCVWNYFHRSAVVLAHHPSPDVITEEAFVLQTNDCPTCAPFVRAYLIELSVVFGREVENAIDQVSLLSYCCPCSYIMMAGSLTQGRFRGIG
jgi:hypothetical protein